MGLCGTLIADLYFSWEVQGDERTAIVECLTVSVNPFSYQFYFVVEFFYRRQKIMDSPISCTGSSMQPSGETCSVYGILSTEDSQYIKFLSENTSQLQFCRPIIFRNLIVDYAQRRFIGGLAGWGKAAVQGLNLEDICYLMIKNFDVSVSDSSSMTYHPLLE